MLWENSSQSEFGYSILLFEISKLVNAEGKTNFSFFDPSKINEIIWMN